MENESKNYIKFKIYLKYMELRDTLSLSFRLRIEFTFDKRRTVKRTKDFVSRVHRTVVMQLSLYARRTNRETRVCGVSVTNTKILRTFLATETSDVFDSNLCVLCLSRHGDRTVIID